MNIDLVHDESICLKLTDLFLTNLFIRNIWAVVVCTHRCKWKIKSRGAKKVWTRPSGSWQKNHPSD